MGYLASDSILDLDVGMVLEYGGLGILNLLIDTLKGYILFWGPYSCWMEHLANPHGAARLQ